MDAPPPYSEIAPPSIRSSMVDAYALDGGASSPPILMTPIYDVSYDQLFKKESSTNYMPNVPTCDTLTFVDFAPLVSDASRHRENFGDLVARANYWLLTVPGWEVLSCETFKQWIDLKTTDTGGNDKLVYYEKTKKETAFFYGLRLWITPRQNPGQPQSIGFSNLTPKSVKRTSRSGQEKVRMQNLKEVLLNFREMQEEQPVPGRIISVQTIKMSVPNISTFDCDNLLWQEEPLYDYTYMNIIRIFYETGTPKNEILGAMDFYPLTDIKLFGKDKRESVSEIVDRAFKAIKDENEKDCSFRLLNVQTLEIEVEKGKKTDTSILMDKDNSKKNDHSRYFRAVYVKNATDFGDPFKSPKVSCKTFLPVVLPDSESASKLNVETIAKTKQRIEAWLKATGCKVISVETVSLRSSVYQEYDSMMEINKCLQSGEYRWIIAFRFYIDGQYTEPPASLLPALPKYDEEKCVIS